VAGQGSCARIRAPTGEDLGVVDEAVDHGGGDDLVAEHLGPATEGQVAGDQDRAGLVAGSDELEEQVRGVGVEKCSRPRR